MHNPLYAKPRRLPGLLLLACIFSSGCVAILIGHSAHSATQGGPKCEGDLRLVTFESGWTAVWTNTGGDQYSVVASHGSDRQTGIKATGEFNGNKFTGHSSNPNTHWECDYLGSMDSDGVTFNGNRRCEHDGVTGLPANWSGHVECVNPDRSMLCRDTATRIEGLEHSLEELDRRGQLTDQRALNHTKTMYVHVGDLLQTNQSPADFDTTEKRDAAALEFGWLEYFKRYQLTSRREFLSLFYVHLEHRLNEMEAARRSPAVDEDQIERALKELKDKLEALHCGNEQRNANLTGEWNGHGSGVNDFGSIVLKGGGGSYTGTYSGTWGPRPGQIILNGGGDSFSGQWIDSDGVHKGLLKVTLSKDGNSLQVVWNSTDERHITDTTTNWSRMVR